MPAQMNESLFEKKILVLSIGRLVSTEYRVLPIIRYLAEPSNRTEYRFSPKLKVLFILCVGPSFLWNFSYISANHNY